MSLRNPLIPYHKFAVVAAWFGLLLGAVVCFATYMSGGPFHPGPLIAVPIVFWAIWSLVWVAMEWLNA